MKSKMLAALLLLVVMSCHGDKKSFYINYYEQDKRKKVVPSLDVIASLANEDIDDVVVLPDSLNFLHSIIPSSKLSCRWIKQLKYTKIGEFFVDDNGDRSVLIACFDEQSCIKDVLWFKSMSRTSKKWNRFYSRYKYYGYDSVLVIRLDPSDEVLHPSQGRILSEDLWVYDKNVRKFNRKKQRPSSGVSNHPVGPRLCTPITSPPE